MTEAREVRPGVAPCRGRGVHGWQDPVQMWSAIRQTGAEQGRQARYRRSPGRKAPGAWQ